MAWIGRITLLKTKFLSEVSEVYTGAQLRPLWIYLNWGLLGTAGVAWVGRCDVSIDKMLDGEDKRANARICGDSMLHFIFELFETDLLAAVFFQRLMAVWIQVAFFKLAPGVVLKRDGDDLYFNNKKLSISIAAPSIRSSLVHFAVNVVNSGTPVETCCLEDFGVNPVDLAHEIFQLATQEWQSIWEATFKVQSV